MPNIVPTARYYPKLSEVITVDDLPEFLSFVQNGLNSIFDKIHYKNLQYSKSVNGDSAFYSLEIVSKKLAIPLPFDLALVLNPDLTSNNNKISSFPITLEYQWEILAFLKTFDLNGFSFSLENFYTIGLKVFRISEAEVLAHIMNYFVEPVSNQTTKYEQFVTDFNLFKSLNYPATPNLVLPNNPSIDSLIQAVNALQIPDKKISLLLFGMYLLNTDLEISKSKLQQFYNIMVPEGIENYIKNLITPRAKATLALSAGIEFPENILRPVTPQGVLIPDTKTTFVFAQAQLYADTQAGIGFQLELGGSLYPSFAEIGKTGMLLQIDTLKLDLSKKTNIPEADADGRPEDFVGVYARAISVTLPAKWFHNDAAAGTSTTTLRLGAYDLLVGTGGLSGTIALETVASVISNSAYYFENKFDINFPIKVLHKNASTNIVETIDVANLTTLKTYLFPTLTPSGATSIPPCPIQFPITLTEKAPLTGGTKTFSSLVAYQQYLNSFPTDNTLDATPTLWKKLGGENGFRIGFNKFDITFKQNKVVHSEIIAQLEIPKLKNVA